MWRLAKSLILYYIILYYIALYCMYTFGPWPTHLKLLESLLQLLHLSVLLLYLPRFLLQLRLTQTRQNKKPSAWLLTLAYMILQPKLSHVHAWMWTCCLPSDGQAQSWAAGFLPHHQNYQAKSCATKHLFVAWRHTFVICASRSWNHWMCAECRVCRPHRTIYVRHCLQTARMRPYPAASWAPSSSICLQPLRQVTVAASAIVLWKGPCAPFFLAPRSLLACRCPWAPVSEWCVYVYMYVWMCDVCSTLHACMYACMYDVNQHVSSPDVDVLEGLYQNGVCMCICMCGYVMYVVRFMYICMYDVCRYVSFPVIACMSMAFKVCIGMVCVHICICTCM